ncbi:hypothetical protein [Mycetocola saprophilus]|uniref:hypothetical protein n=1 Tax=Mycetocola saprophilus TaxID=76636 RepID=UPI003BF2C59F
MSHTRSWTVRILSVLLLVAASMAFVGVGAAQHNSLSPIDEYVYIDYLAKVGSQGAVASGEATGEFAREFLDCHGVQYAMEPRPEFCGTGVSGVDEDYPFGGANTADLYTPIYFAITRVLAQPLMTLGGMDLVAAGRLVGAVWLAAAAVLLAGSLRRLGADRILSVAAPLLLIGSLPIWWSTTFVTTDATAPVAGAALLYVTVRWAQSGRGAWMLPTIALVATLAKLQNLMAVAACAIALVVLAWRRSLPKAVTTRRVVTVLGSMLILPLIGQGVWSVLRPKLADPLSGAQGITQPLTGDALVREVLKFFGSYTTSGRDPLLFNAPGYLVATVLGWAIVGGILAALVLYGPRVVRRSEVSSVTPDPENARNSLLFALALGVLIVSLLGGPLLVAALWLTGQGYFPLPTRYALSLFPIAVAITVILFARARAGRVLILIGAPVAFVCGLLFVFTGTPLGSGS